MKKTRALTATLVASLAFMAAACNTVQGAADDIESVGKAGERAID